MHVHFEPSPLRRAAPRAMPAPLAARRRVQTLRRPRDVGSLIERLYGHYLALYGDPELAAVATSTRVTEALLTVRAPEMAKRAA